MQSGGLFWNDLEHRICKYVSDENKELENLKKLYDEQRNVVISALENGNRNNLFICCTCKLFFIFDSDVDSDVDCGCGTAYCNKCREDDNCDHCKKSMCVKCGALCDGPNCDKLLCDDCDDIFVIVYFINKEQATIYRDFCCEKCLDEYKFKNIEYSEVQRINRQ